MKNCLPQDEEKRKKVLICAGVVLFIGFLLTVILVVSELHPKEAFEDSFFFSIALTSPISLTFIAATQLISCGILRVRS